MRIALDANRVLPTGVDIGVIEAACGLWRPYPGTDATHLQVRQREGPMRRFIVLAILLIGVSALVTAVVENASMAGQRAASPASVTGPTKHPGQDPPGRETLASPVQVLVARFNEGAHVIYRYRVVNGSAWPIAQLLVGYNHLRDESVIGTGPVGWNGDTAATSSVRAPTGWFGETISTEGMDSLYIHWQVDTVTNVLSGGHELTGFAVSVPVADTMYDRGPWTVYLSAGCLYYTGKLVPDAIASVPPRGVIVRDGTTSTPNAARGTVTIPFRDPTTGAALVDLYDSSGRVVRRQPGRVTVDLGSDAAALRSPARLIAFVRNDSGRPIETCNVVIDSLRVGTLTDSAGVGRIANVPAGRWRVRALCQGEIPKVSWMDFCAGREETLRVVFRFEREWPAERIEIRH
jgi:hypothetical protein